jgi:hypothetical protein
MSSTLRLSCFIAAGFVAGVACTFAGVTLASSRSVSTIPSSHAYSVSLDEVKQNLVFAEPFSDIYTNTVRMADGSRRKITLHAVSKNGVPLVELLDQSVDGTRHSFMGRNGTTTDGRLMVSIKDMAELQRDMRQVTAGTHAE